MHCIVINVAGEEFRSRPMPLAEAQDTALRRLRDRCWHIVPMDTAPLLCRSLADQLRASAGVGSVN